MKKMKMVKSRKKFSQGGSTLRSTDGELVRFGYEDDDEYQKRVDADKASQGRKKDVEFSGRTTTRKAVEDAIDATDDYNAGLKIDQRKPPPAPAKPAEPAKLKTEDTDEADRRREEISKLPQKEKSGPEKKPEKKPVAKPEAKPEAKPPGRTASGKTAEQEEEGRKKFAEDEGRRNLQRLQKEDKPLEPVTPEKNLIGGVPLRGAKAMASGLKEMGSYLKDRFGKEAPKVAGQLGHSGKRADNLTKDMGPVELAAGKRSMLQNQSGSSEPIRMGAANRYRAEQAKRNAAAKRQKETESDVSRFEGEGGRAMRKGGKVQKYAKGGSIGSASRRGDGIAVRGKTRGKMF